MQANTKIIIVGKVTREQAEAMAQTLSAQMAVGQPAQPLAAIAISETGQKLAQAFPSSQTHIRLGMLSIQPGDPNYPALFVGNHILGGSGLVSLLFDELRQKNGLVYNVNSSVTPLAANGVFAIGMSTKADQAGKALHLARQTLSDFLQSGPSEAQLLAAKQNILGSFPLRLDSNANITHYISLLARYNLPMDYLDTFQQRLAALSADSVKTAMNQSIKLKQLTEVQVGPQGEKSR